MTVCFSFLASLVERDAALAAEAPAKEQAQEQAREQAPARLTLSSFDLSAFDDVLSPVPGPQAWSPSRAGKLDSPLYDLSDPEAPTECNSETGATTPSYDYSHSRSVTVDDAEAAQEEEPQSPLSPASPASRASPLSPTVGVQHTFRNFCAEFCDPEGVGAGMCGRTFARVCGDAGLPVSEREAAGLFAKLADEEGPGGSGDRRMGLAQFEAALRALAGEHGLEEDDARRMVVAAARPLLQKMVSGPGPRRSRAAPSASSVSVPFSVSVQSPGANPLRKRRAALSGERLAALRRMTKALSFGSVQTAKALGA